LTNGSSITLRGDHTYKIIVQLQQIASGATWAIDPSLGPLTREQGLPINSVIGSTNNSIWDDVQGATDQNLADGGTFTGGNVTWNPTAR